MQKNLIEESQSKLKYKMEMTRCYEPSRAQELYSHFKWWQKGGAQGYDEFAAWMLKYAPDEWEHINKCPLYGRCKHTLTRGQTIEYFKALLKISPFCARALNHIVRATPKELGLKEKEWYEGLDITELD